MGFYRWQQDRLLLSCHIQPKARQDEFVGIHGERLKIRLKAPPVDGRANAALMEFLAKAFAVSKSQVDVVSGQSSRQKTVSIEAPAQLPECLQIQRLQA